MLAKRRAALPHRGAAALCSPTAIGVLRASPELRLNDRSIQMDALDLAYRLLNVHAHLLDVDVDPHGIRVAGLCVIGSVDARRTPPTVGCRTRDCSEC